MAWYPISYIVPQYFESNGRPYSGAVLKAYQVGTLTNIPFATDNTGATTVNSIALNATGQPEVSGNVVIPHIDQDYKLALYPDQDAADADSGADWTINDIDIVRPQGIVTYDTLSDLQAADTSAYDDDDVVYLGGRSSTVDGAADEFYWSSSDHSATGDSAVPNDEVNTGEGDGGIVVAPASDKTGASGAWFRQSHFLPNRTFAPWYGQDITGNQDAKSAVEQALRGLPAEGGEVIIVGDCLISGLDSNSWPGTFIDGSTKGTFGLLIQGTLSYTGTIEVPRRRYIRGDLASGFNAQFHRQPAAKLNDQTPGNTGDLFDTSGIGIRCSGGAVHELRNLDIRKTGPGIAVYMDATDAIGAFADLINVGVKTDHDKAVPIVFDNWFWSWIRDSQATSSSSTYPYSILYTVSPKTISGGYVGLAYIRDTILATCGIRIENKEPSTNEIMGPFLFSGITTENITTPFLTVGGTDYSRITVIDIDRSSNADPSTPANTPFVELEDGATIDRLSIDTSALWDSTKGPVVGGSKYSAAIDLSGPVAGSQVNLSDFDDIKRQSYSLGGQWFGEVTNGADPCGPQVCPVSPDSNFPQTGTNWQSSSSSGTATITDGTLAPDGSSTAFKLESASGVDERRVDATISAAVGDHFIVGVWVRYDSQFTRNIELPFIQSAGSSTIEDEEGNTPTCRFKSMMLNIANPIWRFIYTVVEVTAVDTGNVSLRYSLRANSARPVHYWMPFVAQFPIASWSKAEVWRIAKTLKHATPGVSAGTATTHDHQNLRAGDGAWDGGHMVMGSYHLWVDSTGDLRIKDGAPTSDTDGTIVGTQS